MEVGGSSDRLLSSLLARVLIYRPARGAGSGSARVASAALQRCAVQNCVQCAAPAWRILWYGLTCHWTVTRGALTGAGPIKAVVEGVLGRPLCLLDFWKQFLLQPPKQKV